MDIQMEYFLCTPQDFILYRVCCPANILTWGKSGWRSKDTLDTFSQGYTMFGRVWAADPAGARLVQHGEILHTSLSVHRSPMSGWLRLAQAKSLAQAPKSLV